MEIGILGSLTIRVNGRVVTPTACKLRKGLALLAVRGNEFVPVADLVEELWDERPPRSVRVTLQSYIARLRSLLGGDGQRVLATEHGGYRLRLDPDALDAHRFDTAAARGHQALLEGDYEAASRLLRSAFEVWRGPALVDVHMGRLLDVQAARLDEARLVTLEELVQAELCSGRHREILAELTELTAQYPYHESLYAQLMIALYRSARRQQALEVFHRLRVRLADELGLDPSPQIGQVHRAVLDDDPSLDWPNESRDPTESVIHRLVSREPRLRSGLSRPRSRSSRRVIRRHAGSRPGDRR